MAAADLFGGNMPKRYGNLWSKVIDFENLYKAFTRASRGKRDHGEVLRFKGNLEENLIDIQNRLIWHTWEPSRWRQFTIYEPKKREISAPCFSNRVVHHALMGVLEPYLERRYIHDSYACRPGRGMHMAQKRVQYFLRRERRNSGKIYVLQGDVKSYFASIPHNRLMEAVERIFKDRDVLQMCDLIIRGYGFDIGVPIGALTSQHFANIYLDQLDHFMKDELGIKNYVRYMDDFLVIHPDKGYLKEVLFMADDFLVYRLGLRLNPKTAIYPASQGVNFCGYRTWTTHVLPRKRNVQRARQKIRKLWNLSGKMKTLRGAMASFLGYMQHCSGRTSVVRVIKDLCQ